jgi:hypothetical protein
MDRESWNTSKTCCKKSTFAVEIYAPTKSFSAFCVGYVGTTTPSESNTLF